jgi:hypothetical protein
MSIPPADYREGLDETDSLLLERQRRRYASRAIAYLVLLNGVAALILLASLPHLAGQVTQPGRMMDAMLVFGIGAAIALGSTFFAYVRRTVRLQAPERIPLRVSLWWLSVLAALLAAACFVIGLNMAGRAALPERAGISTGVKPKKHKDQSRAKREDRDADKREKADKEPKSNENDEDSKEAPQPEATPESTTELPASPQPLTRTECEQAGRTWNESTNTCG